MTCTNRPRRSKTVRCRECAYWIECKYNVALSRCPFRTLSCLPVQEGEFMPDDSRKCKNFKQGSGGFATSKSRIGPADWGDD